MRNHPLLGGARHLGDGTVTGTLHEVLTGEVVPYPYPALVRGGGRVVVELYSVLDPAVWSRLDALECYDPTDPAGSEYLRVPVRVRRRTGAVVDAQTYVFDGDRRHLGAVVDDGDWAAWEARRGGRPAHR